MTPAQLTALLQRPELRIADHPHLVTAMRQLVIDPDDPDLMEFVRDQVGVLGLVAQTVGDPFWREYGPTGSLLGASDDIRLLQLRTGDRLSLPGLGLLGNAGVHGPTNSGKSTLIRSIAAQLPALGYVVIYFDRKREARRLLRHSGLCGMVTVLDSEDLQFSLYHALPPVKTRTLITATTNLIGQSTGRVYAQRVLLEAVEQFYERTPTENGLGLDQLIALLKGTRVSGYRQVELKESMLLALKYIRSHLFEIFSYRKTNFLQRLVEKPGLFVVELPALPSDLYGFLVALFMHMLFLLRTATREAQPVPVVFAVDDATIAVGEEVDRQAVSGTAPLTEQIFMSRERGICILLADHAPSTVSSKMIQNIENHLFTGARGEDPHFLRDLIGVTPEQIEYLRVLPRGQAVALIPSRWGRPLLGTFDHDGLPEANDALCRESAQRFLRTVQSERDEIGDGQADGKAGAGATAPVVGSPGNKQGDDEAVRVLLLLTPPISVTKLYDRLQLSRREGVKLLDRLEMAGLIQMHQYSTGARGGRLAVPEITDSGWLLLTGRGLSVKPTQLTHGGFDHNVAAYALEVLGRRERYQTDFEVDVGPVRIDARWRRADGKAMFFQIGVHDPKREADALVRASTVPAVANGTLVLVGLDSGFVKRTLALMSQLNPSGDVAKMVATRLVGQLLKEALE